jgi:putative AlgH/UPF0301 family transcriptional regulator
MSLHKLCLFTMLAVIIASAAARLDHVEGICAGSEILPTVFVPVQSRNVKDLAAGKLLVASRDLADPNFIETVILLVRYDAQGVVGLVLNRRTHVPLSRVFTDLKAAKDRSDPVYLGGPVDTPAVFALFHSSAKIEGAESIFSSVYLISAKLLFEQTISAEPDPNVFHVYLGYAGWNTVQLQKEVELGAWFIFPADVGTVFNSDPDSLWSNMIQKTELKLTRRRIRYLAPPDRQYGPRNALLFNPKSHAFATAQIPNVYWISVYGAWTPNSSRTPLETR